MSLPPVCRTCLSACVHAQAGESRNPFLLSLRANEASAAIPTGKPANWLTKFIGELANWSIGELRTLVFYNLIHKKQDLPKPLSNNI
jgi:hypothetical protein